MTVLHELHSPVNGAIDLATSSEEHSALARVRAAVARLAGGGAVLLCDDAEWPTHGEILFAAADADAPLMAFAIRHGSGFLQVALPASRCDELDLRPQAGADRDGLQQCVTVDARGGIGTGISATDRAATVRLLASRDSGPDSFTRPGHVVPIRAAMDLPATEFGFTEASIALTDRAVAGRAAVLGAVVGIEDPTTMASGAELVRFSSDHGLPLVTLGDVVIDHAVSVTFDQTVALPRGDARLMSFLDDGLECLCLIVGDVRNRSDVPVHVVAAEQILAEPTTTASGPRVQMAIGPGLATDLLTRPLHLRVHDPRSAVRRVLRRAGVRSIRVVTATGSTGWGGPGLADFQRHGE
ncbi:3,4-dihydroxy-2-butanone-4-phosphate synthase [Rhodococcus jostii]|uniref:3,4-dihydroxy-2-butanone-4-phosphate synthase n=1 Tax=Rhodococcus jostii TaxID=132919 RepID=A0ABU4CTU0_RHOJO|nr:3,4-dihydroxy-2-butanone-4-phosphate synthase [Rhodococcus jostii]MDV6286986.1 3,4-dihydroxy-2-butanone-4-phosphate synthase [Rhodococcus jostii]